MIETKPASNSVLIVGGGIAGLSAAKRLKANGIPVLVLEGRDRLGGRVHTIDVAGDQTSWIDMGAAFINVSAKNYWEYLNYQEKGTVMIKGGYRLLIDLMSEPLLDSEVVLGQEVERISIAQVASASPPAQTPKYMAALGRHLRRYGIAVASPGQAATSRRSTFKSVALVHSRRDACRLQDPSARSETAIIGLRPGRSARSGSQRAGSFMPRAERLGLHGAYGVPVGLAGFCKLLPRALQEHP